MGLYTMSSLPQDRGASRPIVWNIILLALVRAFVRGLSLIWQSNCTQAEDNVVDNEIEN